MSLAAVCVELDDRPSADEIETLRHLRRWVRRMRLEGPSLSLDTTDVEDIDGLLRRLDPIVTKLEGLIVCHQR